MRAWERAKYEYSRRSKKDFLIWLYRSLKAKTLLIFHRLLSKSLGEKRYLLFLKKLRSRKLSNSEFIEIIEIDPEEIEYISPLREELKWFSTGKIKSGDWDKNLDRYSDLPFHMALKKRMGSESWDNIDEVRKARDGGIKWPRKPGRVGRDIEKTEGLIEAIEKELPFHRALKKRMDGKEWEDIEEVDEARKGGIKWPRKPDEVDKDIEKTEKLISSIRQDGYLTQEQIKNIAHDEAEKHIRLDVLNEVCVDLDRNGKPLFVDGRHRLSLAKIMDIHKIPVRVVMRHKELEREK